MDIQEMISNHTNSIVKGYFSSPDVACQRCQQKPEAFKLHESRKRQFRMIVENIVKVTVSFLLRWKCIDCGATFTEYPSFALPYKRFVLTDINRLSHKYLSIDTLSYRGVVKENGVDIAYLDSHDLCKQFVSHSSVWRFMTYLADRWQTTIHNHILEKTVHAVPPFKYRSKERRTLLYKAFKVITNFNIQTNEDFFPNFETGST